MKRIAVIIMGGWPFLIGAHPCPYDWNIEFAKKTEIRGDNITDFATKLNAAVLKEADKKIKRTIVVEMKPDTFTKIPDKSPFAKQMGILIQSYTQTTAPLIEKGARQYGTAPIEAKFPAKFPIACILSLTLPVDGISYTEKKDGAHVTVHRDLECHAYKLSEKFLKTAQENQKSGGVPRDCDPITYTFARYSGMRWKFYVFDKEKELQAKSIIEGILLYLPNEKVILAIETKRGHSDLNKAMKERGYLD